MKKVSCPAQGLDLLPRECNNSDAHLTEPTEVPHLTQSRYGEYTTDQGISSPLPSSKLVSRLFFIFTWLLLDTFFFGESFTQSLLGMENKTVRLADYSHNYQTDYTVSLLLYSMTCSLMH